MPKESPSDHRPDEQKVGDEPSVLGGAARVGTSSPGATARPTRASAKRRVVLIALATLAFPLAYLLAPSGKSTGVSELRAPSAASSLRAVLSEVSPRPTIDTSPAQSALAPLRARLSIPPRAWPPAGLAFTGERVAHVVDEGIELVNLAKTPDEATRSTVRMDQVRALFTLGASLGAVVERHVVLFEPGKDEPQRWPGVTWLPYARVFPDLVSPSHLLVLHPPDRAIYRYLLEGESGPLLPLSSHHELANFDERVFIALRDGSFVYSSAEGFTRLYTSGLTKKLKAPASSVAPLRGFRAQRIDQIFILYQNGLVQRFQLSDRMRVVWSTQLESIPFDLAAAGDNLVLLEDVPGAQRSWRLRVIGPRHDQPLVVELGTSQPRGDDWVGELFERFGLVTSNGRVAVAGPGGLSVWQVTTGERLFGPI